MQFSDPQFAWFFLSIPLYLLGLYLLNKDNRKKLKKIGSPNLIKQLTKNIDWNKRIIKYCLIVLILNFLTLGLMNPKWGRKKTILNQKGRDIILLIDISKSMLTEDITPSRLEKVKIKLNQFIDKLKNERVGIVLFAGSAFVFCPLTLDHGALKLYLNHVTVNLIQNQGTSLTAALTTAKDCFDPKEKTHKAIILLTDGENHEKGVMKAAKECYKENIRIFIAGIGNPKGELIPIKNQQGEIIEYLKNRQGNLVVSKLNEDILKKIAQLSKGKYYNFSSNKFILDTIHKNIQSIERKSFGSRKIQQKASQYQFFILMVIILLVVETYLKETKNNQLKK